MRRWAFVLLAAVTCGPTMAIPPSNIDVLPRLPQNLVDQCRSLEAQRDGQDRARIEKLVELYETTPAEYDDKNQVFLDAFASHDPKDILEIAVFQPDGELRVLFAGYPEELLTASLLSLVAPQDYVGRLEAHLSSRFPQYARVPKTLANVWIPLVKKVAEHDRPAGVRMLRTVFLADPAAGDRDLRVALIQALSEVADGDPDGVLKQHLSALLAAPKADHFELSLCVRVLGQWGDRECLQILVDGLDDARIPPPSYWLLVQNTFLSEKESRRYFGRPEPHGGPDLREAIAGWRTWWDDNRASVYWHPAHRVWTAYRGEFWHPNSLLPKPYDPPALIYLVGILGLLAAGWLMFPRRVMPPHADGERFKPRDLATVALFLCVFAVLSSIWGVASLAPFPLGSLRWVLGWGLASAGLVVLGRSALRFVRTGAPDEHPSLAEQRLLTGWLTAATLVGLAVVCLFSRENRPPPYVLGVLAFVLSYAVYFLSRRVLRRRRERAPMRLQFSLGQLLAAVTICCVLLSLWSMRRYLGSVVPLRGAVLGFPVLAYVVLAFRAARRPGRPEAVVNGEPSDVGRRVRTSRAVVAVTVLLLLGAAGGLALLAMPILFILVMTGPLGLPVAFDVVLGGVVSLVAVGALTALLAGHRLGRGFCWVFGYAAGWAAGFVVYLAAACFMEHLELPKPFLGMKLALSAAGLAGGTVLARWVQGFADTSARRAGQAGAGAIAMGMVLFSLRAGFCKLSADHALDVLLRAVWAGLLAAICASLLGAIWGALGRRRPRSPT